MSKMTAKTARAINRGRRAKGLKPIRFSVLKRARKKAARKKTTTRSRRKAPARKRRATARKAPARPRRPRKKTALDLLLDGLKKAAPVVVGIAVAPQLGRVANTPLRHTLAVAAAAVVAALGARQIARTVPLVSAAAVQGVSAGLFADLAFRGTATLRARLPASLPASTRRPGGLLAGRPARRTSADRATLDLMAATL